MNVWPLTARRSQLDALGTWYGDLSVGGCLLTGAAGVGKTRLAEEVLRLADETGRPTGRVIGHSSTRPIPLGALTHLLPSGIADLASGPDGRGALFHAARSALALRAGRHRLLLVIDDIDQLDELSLALLVPLVLQRSMFLVATMRSGQLLPGPVSVLVKDGLMERQELAALTDEQVATLLRRILGGPLDDDGLRRLQDLAGGNLQLLRELLRSAGEQNVLHPDGDGWRLQGTIDTAGLEDLVLARLSSVAETDRRALELLAVAGSMGLADMESVFGRHLLERLDRNDLIVVSRNERRTEVRLAHPLYHEALRSQLSLLRERTIQRKLAERMERYGARRRDDALRLAQWRLNGGGPVDAQFLIGAGHVAVAARDDRLALRFARAAADLGMPAAVPVEIEAHLLTGAVGAALASINTAWDDPGLGDEQIEYLARRGADLRFGLADLDGALALNRAGQLRVADPILEASLHAHRAALLATAAQPRQALAEADLSLAAAPNHPRLRIESAIARSVAHTCLGSFGTAAFWAREAMKAQSELPAWLSSRGMATHLVNEAHALAYAGHYRAARLLMEPALERAERAGAHGAALWFNLVLAEIARDTGNGREASSRFTAAARGAEAVGQAAVLVWAEVGVAQSLLLTGEVERAREALAAADAQGHSPMATSDHTRERTRAWLMAAQGDLAGARQLLSALADDMAGAEVYAFEAPLRHDLARFGDAVTQRPRMEQLASMIDGPLVQAFAHHIRGLAAGKGEELEAALALFEDMDAAVLGAETAAELADLHHRAGDRRAATAAVRRMTGLLDRCGGARTPGLVMAAATVIATGAEPLTAREREVALLAANGLTSRHIAEQLYISKRTVDAHLDRIYRKLGVSGREELKLSIAP